MAGMISDATREQIRAASDIVEIIGAVVPLKRAGGNFIGLCPFHREKTPSFNVSPSRQMFRCFGCGKGGDVFTFIKEYENVPFGDALRRLAERARIALPEDDRPGADESRAVKDKLLTMHEEITKRWQAALTSDAGGQVAREHLARRGVSEEGVKLFRIGYAPDSWDDTVNFARSRNWDPGLVELAGLVVRKESGGQYDRFRGRLMFPICDEQGRVIAFSGRILQGDEKTAKYVNSPETPLFTKSRVVFGLDKSKRAILERQFALVCEGQLDMIACFMAGVQNAVAPQGTAFTGEQARIIKRYTKEVVLCFDSDNAGQKATVRALDELLESGLSVRVATLPAPHDPDSFIKEFGAVEFTRRIDGAVGFFDFYLDLLCRQNAVNSDRGRREIARSMAVALEKTRDALVFDRYARQTVARLGADAVHADKEFRRLATAAAPFRPAALEEPLEEGAAPDEPALPPPSPPELWVLKLALLNDDQLEWLAAHLDFHWLEHPAAKAILEARLSEKEGGGWPQPVEIMSQLEEGPTRTLLLELATEASHIRIPDSRAAFEQHLSRLRNLYLDRQISQVMAQIAEPGLRQEEFVELVARQTALRQARSAKLAPVSDAWEI